MVMTKVKNKHDFLYQLTSERINMWRTVWANGQSYVQNLKTPDVHILYIITQFITVSFNDKMMQLHFKTTKHFKNSEPLTCKVLEENKQTNNKKQQNEPNKPTNHYQRPLSDTMPKESGNCQKASYKSETRKRTKILNSRIQIKSWSIVTKTYYHFRVVWQILWNRTEDTAHS